MNKLFISYELALLAKNKGFDELCFGYFNFKNELVLDENNAEFYSIQHEYGMAFKNSIYPLFTTAPLYQQIIDWFREKYGLYIYIMGSAYLYPCIDNIKADGDSTIEIGEFEDYYEALNKAIEKTFLLI